MACCRGKVVLDRKAAGEPSAIVIRVREASAHGV